MKTAVTTFGCRIVRHAMRSASQRSKPPHRIAPGRPLPHRSDCISVVPLLIPASSAASPCALCPRTRHFLRKSAMPDALELLKTRRSVKPLEMTGPGPAGADIDTLLTVASRVPDHGKLAPWRFIVFSGDARRAAGDRIATVFSAARPDATADQVAFERGRFARAPLVIAVVSRAAPHAKIPEWEQQLSAGAACMNLVTAAHAMGYVATWLTEWPAYARAAADRMDHVDERQGRRQSRALLVFQRHQQPAEHRHVRQRRPQGLARLYRGDRRVRLQSRHLG